jgi:hypothetical protein
LPAAAQTFADVLQALRRVERMAICRIARWALKQAKKRRKLA